MTIIPVYDNKGELANQIEIDDDLNFVNDRVCKGKQYYYKGVGVKYDHQYIEELNDDYELISPADVFYIKYKVAKKCFIGKSGIFQEPYLFIYDDWVGTCGPKEGLIVLNSSFKYSSVDVIDYVQFDEEHRQAYYVLDYKCNRKKYARDGGDPKKLGELIDYMLNNDWNFLWDKNVIQDITPEGLVSDVGDMFTGEDLTYKLGTAYSVLYSLGQANFQQYVDFVEYHNIQQSSNINMSYMTTAMKLLQKNNIDISPLIQYNDILLNYKHAVLTMMDGKNCAHCACDMYTEQGEKIKQQYKDNLTI